MSTPLPWEDQGLSDPNALRAFIELCDLVRQDVGDDPTVYHHVTSSEQMAEDMAAILEKRDSDEMWFVGGKQDEEGVHLMAFCGNGPNSEYKACFIQLALQLLPLLLRDRLGWMELMGEDLDVDDQLRNTES
jgi:DNA-binding transcriptional ArsR family regulator